MKPTPNVWSLKSLTKVALENSTEIDGKWVPVRPLGFIGLFLFHRISVAWRVFTGELDAVKWPCGQ